VPEQLVPEQPGLKSPQQVPLGQELPTRQVLPGQKLVPVLLVQKLVRVLTGPVLMVQVLPHPQLPQESRQLAQP
jgi:hypothetical protein